MAFLHMKKKLLYNQIMLRYYAKVNQRECRRLHQVQHEGKQLLEKKKIHYDEPISVMIGEHSAIKLQLYALIA
jgi:hypothetical protein